MVFGNRTTFFLWSSSLPDSRFRCEGQLEMDRQTDSHKGKEAQRRLVKLPLDTNEKTLLHVH